nr:putative ribonuclease H-like domain-containing protein [Tanacetum cinerariifolium]
MRDSIIPRCSVASTGFPCRSLSSLLFSTIGMSTESLVFFLEHKDETYPILKDFINLVENQLNKKLKAIRCDNGTEFKNLHMTKLCGYKGIKREYSNARTPQQNGVAEKKNKTLIEATRTMLADFKLPTMFWTEAVELLVIHSKPFGCHVTILNTSDHLGGKVTFGGGEGRITGKGKIRTPTLDFENVYYVKELQQFNLFSISQICDKKNQVLFTDTECLVLSKDFKFLDENMVVLKVPRKQNLYTINLNDLCPRGNLACLVAHAIVDESIKWHRRMGHVNYKNMNRLVKGKLVRGLPPKLFKHVHTCVVCCKSKRHKASYKVINAVSSIFDPLQLLHMDLFGPIFIRSIDHKYYCLVITDNYRRFC